MLACVSLVLMCFGQLYLTDHTHGTHIAASDGVLDEEQLRVNGESPSRWGLLSMRGQRSTHLNAYQRSSSSTGLSVYQDRCALWVANGAEHHSKSRVSNAVSAGDAGCDDIRQGILCGNSDWVWVGSFYLESVDWYNTTNAQVCPACPPQPKTIKR